MTWLTKLLTANVALLLLLSPVISCMARGEDGKPTLIVLDRSMSKNGQYQCMLHLPKDYPVESMAITLYDRNKNKSGEFLLAPPSPSLRGKIAVFYLNHELVKHSVLHLQPYPPEDERHTQLNFVIGENAAFRMEDGKKLEVPIE